MKLLKNIIVKIVLVIMVCIISFNLYNFICLKVLKEDLATVNGYALLEVVSGSMEPTIHVGDMIIIDTKYEGYEKDDIITFRDENKSFVTHRLININENKMVTKGDNNNTADEEMSTNNIVGKVVKIIPAGGMILDTLKSPLVMVFILIIGILMCVFSSTDGDLVPVDLTDEEKEFLEYKKNKIEQAKAKNINVVDYSTKPKEKIVEGPKKTKKKSTKKITVPEEEPEQKKEKTTTKKTTTKKSTSVTGTKKNTKKTSKKSETKTSTKKTTKKEVKAESKATPKKTTKKTTEPKKGTKKSTNKNDDKTIKKSTKKTVGAKKTTKK